MTLPETSPEQAPGHYGAGYGEQVPADAPPRPAPKTDADTAPVTGVPADAQRFRRRVRQRPPRRRQQQSPRRRRQHAPGRRRQPGGVHARGRACAPARPPADRERAGEREGGPDLRALLSKPLSGGGQGPGCIFIQLRFAQPRVRTPPRCSSTASSRSSPTPPSTTPPAPPAARRSATRSTASGIGSTEGIGHLPQLRARRPLHLAAQDPAHQLLRLRLPLLRQPGHAATCARARFTRRRGRAAHARLLPAQLHRGPVPQLAGSSASPDYTMEQVVEVARVLREEHDFRGYIHLKTIPEASADLLARAGRYADRLSINIELPTAQSLAALAPEKDGARDPALDGAAARPHRRRQGGSAAGAGPLAGRRRAKRARPPRFAPAGQSTQMIVGADATDDARDPRRRAPASTARTG